MLNEFEKYVEETRKGVHDMLEWAKKANEEGMFDSTEGKQLLKDISEVARYQAYLYFDMASIELTKASGSY